MANICGAVIVPINMNLCFMYIYIHITYTCEEEKGEDLLIDDFAPPRRASHGAARLRSWRGQPVLFLKSAGLCVLVCACKFWHCKSLCMKRVLDLAGKGHLV